MPRGTGSADSKKGEETRGVGLGAVKRVPRTQPSKRRRVQPTVRGQGSVGWLCSHLFTPNCWGLGQGVSGSAKSPEATLCWPHIQATTLHSGRLV